MPGPFRKATPTIANKLKSSYDAAMIYLASQSPRRAELLRQIGVQYQVLAADIDESKRDSESPEQYVCRMAETKAMVVAREVESRAPGWVVLAADTTIAIDGDIIGKPAQTAECRCILEKLSARSHEVLTAVALASADHLEHRLTRNRVEFRSLQAAEIEAYCASAEPMDKAGAYAIQGKAAVFVRRLEGSYSAVMGLPLCETAELLRGADIEIF